MDYSIGKLSGASITVSGLGASGPPHAEQQTVEPHDTVQIQSDGNKPDSDARKAMNSRTSVPSTNGSGGTAPVSSTIGGSPVQPAAQALYSERGKKLAERVCNETLSIGGYYEKNEFLQEGINTIERRSDITDHERSILWFANKGVFDIGYYGEVAVRTTALNAIAHCMQGTSNAVIAKIALEILHFDDDHIGPNYNNNRDPLFLYSSQKMSAMGTAMAFIAGNSKSNEYEKDLSKRALAVYNGKESSEFNGKRQIVKREYEEGDQIRFLRRGLENIAQGKFGDYIPDPPRHEVDKGDSMTGPLEDQDLYWSPRY